VCPSGCADCDRLAAAFVAMRAALGNFVAGDAVKVNTKMAVDALLLADKMGPIA
jgi:hypothetical protein